MNRNGGNLRGLVRLRTVRERDSRIGLATALTEEQAVARRIADLEHQLATFPVPELSALTRFQDRQLAIDAIRTALGTARHDLETAALVSAAARDRWIADKTRLDAVESLVERRAAAARAERRRREVQQLDEVAEQMWRRREAALVTDGGAA